MYEEIIAEIEHRAHRCEWVADDLRNKENRDYYLGKAEAYREAIPLLEQKKPSEDFDKEFERIWDTELSGRCDTEVALKVARHFAQWQKEQMMKDAVEGKIVGLPARNDIEMRADQFSKATANFKDGDIVKLIIVKED